MAQRIVPGGTAARAIAGKTAQELATQRHEFEEDLHPSKPPRCGSSRPAQTWAESSTWRWSKHSGRLQSLMGNVLNRLDAEERDS